jgi:hypothetical protein
MYLFCMVTVGRNSMVLLKMFMLKMQTVQCLVLVVSQVSLRDGIPIIISFRKSGWKIQSVPRVGALCNS